MAKKQVIVLMGGRTPEHDVSLVTGREVVRHLDRRKYEILPVVISRDGARWQLKTTAEILRLSPAGVGRRLKRAKTKKSSMPIASKQTLPVKLERAESPVVFIAMHGPFGEDGTIQGMIELMGLPYTGAGVLASALGMDKIMFRKVMEREKIPIPDYFVFNQGDRQTTILKKFKFPFIVKPFDQGSSVGVSLVHQMKELKSALKEAFVYSDPILIDQYLKGIEVSCGVIGNEKPMALPVIEIVPKKEFFDYEAKYQPEMCEEIVPARISSALTKRVQEAAVRVFQAIGCRGFGRVDMIIVRGQPYVLEINTIPGLTPNSLLPQEAAAAGMSYSQLLDRVIELALE